MVQSNYQYFTFCIFKAMQKPPNCCCYSKNVFKHFRLKVLFKKATLETLQKLYVIIFILRKYCVVYDCHPKSAQISIKVFFFLIALFDMFECFLLEILILIMPFFTITFNNSTYLIICSGVAYDYVYHLLCVKV